MAASISNNAVTQNSPLVNLAPEILQMILIKYFDDGSLVVTVQPEDGSNRKPHLIGMPSLNLEATCKLLREQSLAVRKKHVTLKLVAKGVLFMVAIMSVYLRFKELTWVRERVASIEAAVDLSSWVRTKNVLRGLFPWVFPNLKDIELHGDVAWSRHSRSQTFEQHMPLDCEEKKRNLAKIIIKDKTSDNFARNWVSAEFIPLEEAYHNARTYSSGDNQISFGTPATEVSIRFRLLTQMNYHQDGQDIHIYDLASKYESKGWNDQALHRGIDLTTLSHVCKIDTIEENYERGVGEDAELPTLE